MKFILVELYILLINWDTPLKNCYLTIHQDFFIIIIWRNLNIIIFEFNLEKVFIKLK